ncbi:MAG: recombinase family protein [Oscillospiraceae bacterium]|nr:recombinase family protein [Oscillospiraceae bacterium]
MRNSVCAIYMRLSREDGTGKRESESISNQRILLMQYARQHGITVTYQFADDGISGITMNRDAFRQMLSMIEDGEINILLVKDLSRLSRDYIRTGELLEYWFPAHGVRFISVDDGIDTRSATSCDFFPIRAVMDDWYARDISRKVRAALYARQAEGYCTTPALPFGYQRSDCNIIINDKQAGTVRMIYDMYLNGAGFCMISAMLRDPKAPVYSAERCWSDVTVRRILKNTAYIGRLRLHSTQKLSYKSDIRINTDNPVFYPVPPIISETVFEAVQNRIISRSHSRPSPHWMSGKITCGCCGARMHITGLGAKCRIVCGMRKRGGECRNPSLSMSVLLRMIDNQLCTDGIPDVPQIRRRMILRICISAETVTVHVRYRRPAAASNCRICE